MVRSSAALARDSCCFLSCAFWVAVCPAEFRGFWVLGLATADDEAAAEADEREAEAPGTVLDVEALREEKPR